MKLSKIVVYDLDFQTVWHQWSAALVGAFLFLRILLYLGIRSLADISGWQLWMELILPVIIGVGYIGLLRGVQLNRPLVYGILGAVFCVFMIACGFSSGNTFRALIGLVWYLLTAAALLATVTGFVSNRLIILVCFAAPCIFRIFADHIIGKLMHLQLASLIPDLAIVCALAGFACLAPALTGRKPA